MDSYIKDRFGNYLGGHGGDNRGYGDRQQHAAEPQMRPMPPKQPNQITQFNAGPSTAVRDRLAAARMQRGMSSGGVRPKRGQQKSRFLKQWNEKCQIQNITIPQLISSATCSKRFRITLTWVDQSGRPHQQDINFGQQGKQQFIDHQDDTIRDARLAQLKTQTLINPLHPNFWQFHLLNKYSDINIAYFKFVQSNKLTEQKLVLKKQFRRSHNPSSASVAKPKSQLSNFQNSLNNSLNVPNQTQNDLLGELQTNYRYGTGQY